MNETEIDYRMIVNIDGTKGGSGKTTISAILATGSGYLGASSIVLSTDPEEAPRKGRIYYAAEAYTKEKLQEFRDKLAGMAKSKKVALIIDGVANREHQVKGNSKIADITIFPTKGSIGDYHRTKSNLDMIPGSFWVLNDEAINNDMRMRKVDAEMESILGPYKDRMLNPIKRCESLKALSSFDAKPVLTTEAIHICIAFAKDVWRKRGYDVDKMEAEFKEKQSQLRSQRAKERYAQNQANQAQSDATE